MPKPFTNNERFTFLFINSFLYEKIYTLKFIVFIRCRAKKDCILYCIVRIKN